MEHIGLTVEDHGQVILRTLLQSTDREIEVPRRERDQESGVLLILNRNRLGKETRDLRGEHDRCGPRLRSHREVVDDELVEWLLND